MQAPHRLRNEASLAALCGVAPVPASSGQITRQRLRRGGDRAANNALYRIALVRMSAHQQTRDYVGRQHGNGRTKKEIVRLLPAWLVAGDARQVAALTGLTEVIGSGPAPVKAVPLRGRADPELDRRQP